MRTVSKERIKKKRERKYKTRILIYETYFVIILFVFHI